MQRFEHQDQRKLLFARQPLAKQVRGHRAGQGERKSHEGSHVRLGIEGCLAASTRRICRVWRLPIRHHASVGELIVPADRMALQEGECLEGNHAAEGSADDLSRNVGFVPID